MILGDEAGGDGQGGSLDLDRYIRYDRPALEPAPAFDGAGLRLSIVRPPVLQPAAGPGLCRRPVESPVAGYLVNRTAAVAGEFDDVDGDGPSWSVGDAVDVYPVRAASRACGRCWACRLPRVARAVELGRRVVAAVRRPGACRRPPPASRAHALLESAASWYGGRLVWRCGACWACRVARAVAAIRRRNVTIAVAGLMVGPLVVFLFARWVL